MVKSERFTREESLLKTELNEMIIEKRKLNRLLSHINSDINSQLKAIEELYLDEEKYFKEIEND